MYRMHPASDQIRLSLDDQHATTIIYAKAFYLTEHSMKYYGIIHVHLLWSIMYVQSKRQPPSSAASP
jgi:hypothetical protein